MDTENWLSRVREALDRADARAVAAESSAAAGEAGRSPAKFATGQSVLQWWAMWFANCPFGEAPKQISKKKGRPSWYSAEIISYSGRMDIIYAGVRTAGHTYMVT
jgi:hypothetical protein